MYTEPEPGGAADDEDEERTRRGRAPDEESDDERMIGRRMTGKCSLPDIKVLEIDGAQIERVARDADLTSREREERTSSDDWWWTTYAAAAAAAAMERSAATMRRRKNKEGLEKSATRVKPRRKMRSLSGYTVDPYVAIYHTTTR